MVDAKKAAKQIDSVTDKATDTKLQMTEGSQPDPLTLLGNQQLVPDDKDI